MEQEERALRRTLCICKGKTQTRLPASQPARGGAREVGGFPEETEDEAFVFCLN